MTSRRQAEANRRNALSSTGPRTPEGRTASSRNATKHGVLSSHFVAEHEDSNLFARLFEDLKAEFQPDTAMESLLVERLAMLFWRERRLAIAESEQANLHFADGTTPFGGGRRNVPIIDQYLVGRYQGMLGRQIKETLRDLRQDRESRFLHIGLPTGGEDETEGSAEF